MMDDEDLPSDTDDEDYCPSAGEAVSEDDISGEEELPLLDEGKSDAGKLGKGKRKKVKRKAGQPLEPRKRAGGIKLDEPESEETSAADLPPDDDYNKQLGEQLDKERAEKKEQDEKTKADSLWADFMKDVGPTKPKPKPSTGLGALSKPLLTQKSGTSPVPTTKSEATPSTTGVSTSAAANKITITKEYDFAGETVKVTKQVDADSKEAKAELMKQGKIEETDNKATKAGPSIANLKRPAGGGLGSVLGMIGKKQKISTLDKSKLDWDSFKHKEGIDDELQIHNRSKDSYLERMAFLERTDHRQFEIEKNLRLTSSKR